MIGQTISHYKITDKGIVKLTDFGGTKPPYGVFRPGLATHTLGCLSL